jgi:DNA-binding phage protein
MSQVTAKYEDGLKAHLTDPFEAVAYLNAALEDGSQEVFLLALRDVMEASVAAKLPHLNKENMYRILSRKENPQLSSLNSLLQSIGLRLAVEVQYTSA